MPLPLISARLPSALNSSIITSVRSPPAWTRRDPQQAVGADAAMAVAQRARASRAGDGAGAVEVEQDEEVVAEAVVLGQPHAAQVCPSRRRARHDLLERCSASSGSDVGVEPVDAGIAAEPRPLAAGELPGAAHGVVERPRRA